MFYSSIPLWPTQEGHNMTQMEGGSPIIWTMLHPPSVEVHLQTYAWKGHSDNFMPWTIGQTDGANTRPPLLLYAQWGNIQHSSNSTSPLYDTITHTASPSSSPVTSRHSISLGTTIYRLIVVIYSCTHHQSTLAPE